jgi:gamma-aminobutyric acid type B receptor
MYGLYPEKWWTNDVARDKLDECTEEDLENFLIVARPLIMDMIPEPDAPTDTGFTAKNFTNTYTDRLDSTQFKTKSALHAIAFDAVWTLALVLNYTEEMRLNQSKEQAIHQNCSSNLTGDLVPLNKFNYSNAYMGCVMKHNFYKVNFTGVSGPVRYEENGTIVYTRVRFTQLRVREKYGIERVHFGYMDIDSNYSLIFEENETMSSIYPDGFPPDGTAIDVLQTYHVWLVTVYYVLALCGVVLSGICFAFNFFFRNREIVRLTSPVLSYVIVSGAVLMYLSVFIGLLPATHETLFRAQCIVHAWVYGIGYLLVYGTILAKMWRVYQIFHNPKPKQGLLKTWHMLCIVATIAGIGVLLLSTKTIVQVFYHPVLVPNSEDPDGTTGKDILEKHYVWRCYSSESHLLISDIIIFIYLSLLQFVGIILAFQTRKVKITALNDSKSVTALIYISSIVLVVIVLITFILRSHINISAAVFAGGIIVLATFFLVLVFIPKVVNLYRDPAGEMIFDNMMSASTKVSNSTHHLMVTGVFHQINGEKLNSHATN